MLLYARKGDVVKCSTCNGAGGWDSEPCPTCRGLRIVDAELSVEGFWEPDLAHTTSLACNRIEIGDVVLWESRRFVWWKPSTWLRRWRVERFEVVSKRVDLDRGCIDFKCMRVRK